MLRFEMSSICHKNKLDFYLYLKHIFSTCKCKYKYMKLLDQGNNKKRNNISPCQRTFRSYHFYSTDKFQYFTRNHECGVFCEFGSKVYIRVTSS